MGEGWQQRQRRRTRPGYDDNTPVSHAEGTGDRKGKEEEREVSASPPCHLHQAQSLKLHLWYPEAAILVQLRDICPCLCFGHKEEIERNEVGD